MAGRFMMKGVCPVCGNANAVYNPCLPMITDQVKAQKEEQIKKKFPWSIFRCYHTGTPFHNTTNFSASDGTLYPMHLYFMHETQDHYHRYYPDASDDCNKRHWKVK